MSKSILANGCNYNSQGEYLCQENFIINKKDKTIKTYIEKFENEDIDIDDIPYEQGDKIFQECVDKIKKNNGKVNKLDLIKCTHKYCANMRSSSSADSGSITTNLIPIESFNGEGKKKKKKWFYISVCCTSDYCKMINEQSHKYKEINGNYYLVKTNNNYNKIVQLLFNDKEDVLEDGKHLSGLGGNLSICKLEEICNLN
jgi:hypothetical protein